MDITNLDTSVKETSRVDTPSLDSSSLVRTLRAVLPSQILPVVVRALAREPLVWQSLQEQAFLERVIAAASDEAMPWTPGNIALIHLDESLTAADLREMPLVALDSDLRQKAVRFFDLYRQQADRGIKTLSEAALVGLALRERARILGNWQNLAQEIPARKKNDNRLILACAYDYLPEADTYLRDFCQESKQLGLCADVIFRQPYKREAQARLVAGLSQTVRSAERLELLWQLEKSQPDDARLVAHELLQHEKKSSTQPINAANHLWLIPEKMYLSEVRRLAGLPDQAVSSYGQLEADIGELRAEVTYHLLSEGLKNNQFDLIDRYLSQTNQTDWPSGEQLAVLSFRLFEAGQEDRAQTALQAAGETTAALITRVRFLSEDLSEGERTARLLQAVNNWECNPQTHPALLLEAGRLLLDFDRPDQALQLARYLIDCLPEDPHCHVLLARAARRYGSAADAVTAAHLAAALAPDDQHIQRELIAALESGHSWPEAYEEWKAMVDFDPEHWESELSTALLAEQQRQDYRGLALAAARAGDTETALEICWKILENLPDDGLTHLLLGQIFELNSEPEVAIEHFIRANQLLPDYPEAWLCLARAYLAQGSVPAAENTLKTACQAIPENAELLLTLGRLYDQQGQPTQALNVLQKAVQVARLDLPETGRSAAEHNFESAPYLPPTSAEIVLLLGSTLVELGHNDRAAEVLESAYRTKEHKQAAAYMYARALQAVGKERQALSALSIAHQTDPDNPDLALEYARLLLKLGEQPDVAVAILEKQIASGSKEPEILALMAEALAGAYDFHSALAYYQKAMESNLMVDPHWSIRLALGLSHVALQTSTPNLAIAALQDAIQQAPEHLALHQKLAEACLAAGLKDDALHVASQAYRMSPANIDNILWFSDCCLQLNADSQAYETLKEAKALFPNHIDLHLQLAQLEARTGRVDSAIENFRSAAEMSDISLEQLYKAAGGLLELNQPQACVDYLERVQHELLQEPYSVLHHRMLVLLASAYDALGENEAALQLIEKALLHQPGSTALLKQKAIIHLRLQQFKAAAACLHEVVHIEPRDPETHRLLMQTYEAEGDLATALEHAQTALTLTSPEKVREAVLEASRLAWCLFQQQDAARFLAAFSSSPSTREQDNSSQSHRLISVLIALDSNHWELISELKDLSSQTESRSPVDLAITALDHALHGEVEVSRQLLQEIAGREQTGLQPPLLYGLWIETALRSSEFQLALRLAKDWQSQEQNNPRAYLAELRTVTEIAERDNFLSDVGAAAHLVPPPGETNSAAECKDKLLALFGYHGGEKQGDPPVYTLLPELVRRWIIRSRAAGMDLSDLASEEEKLFLQEFSRLAPDPGSIAAYAAATRRLRLDSQSIRAAKEYPNQPNVLAQLALSSLQLDSSAAMAAALNAMELAVTSPEQIILPAYHALIASAAAAAKNFHQAYRALTHALSDWPDEPVWQGQAAEYARQTDDLAACIQHLEKAVALDSGSKDYRLKLAQCYQAAGALNRAAEAYQTLCEEVPGDVAIWLEFAELQFERGQVVSAAECAENALTLSPADVENILFTAQIQFYAENYARAQVLAGQVIESEPENASAAFLLARCLSAVNRKEAALEVLDRALRYSDRPLELYLERIRLIRALQGMQPAFQSLQALDRQHPDHPGILALRAEYEQAQGLIAEALASAQKALQIGSEDFNPQEKSRLHALIGRILRRAGQLDQAVHQFSQAINLNPSRIELYLELGKTYQDRRQLEEALRVYENAIQVAPEDPRPYQQAGQALKECKDYIGAEKMIRRAAELSPHDISIHRLLGSLVALNLVHNS